MVATPVPESIPEGGGNGLSGPRGGQGVITREHAHLDLVEVLEESVEDGQQVLGGERVTQHVRELV